MLVVERILRHGAKRPDPIVASWRAGLVCAPVAGFVLSLADAPDPTFASGMLGMGLAIQPQAEVVYAPVSGSVGAFLHAGHAVALKADGGAQVLVHVGADTVRLHGHGFTPFAKAGQRVEAGDALLTFDSLAIREAGLDDTVMLTVMNPLACGGVGLLVEPGERLTAGQPVLRTGPSAKDERGAAHAPASRKARNR